MLIYRGSKIKVKAGILLMRLFMIQQSLASFLYFILNRQVANQLPFQANRADRSSCPGRFIRDIHHKYKNGTSPTKGAPIICGREIC